MKDMGAIDATQPTSIHTQKTPNSSSVSASYVCLLWIQYLIDIFVSVPVIIDVISYNIEPRYNDTRLTKDMRVCIILKTHCSEFSVFGQ